MAYQTMQCYAICYQWFKQRLMTERISNPNGHRLKRTSSNPLCQPENLISKHTPL